ncbi:hypothetical protein [Micromonospora ureilytica]|uniref:Integral membrane protein n=1 Tax=Micromonospora ureilytica TaxID=709868 RepID=A0ABS0JCT7_9ACTN|nr:hypothetical protein [Micromonospora ureilytica]MBG6064560.1 hypothetical protein [Micromonospora ureilytica]
MDQREAAGRAGPDGVVQLRVHGVSAIGPEDLLDRPDVQQVAGDHRGGFYRVRPGNHEGGETDGVTLEAYRWNNLPAGNALRTLAMVILLPFMLINLAIWMRPAGAGSDPVIKALCRLLALTLTGMYVLSMVGIALDVIAWKCMSSPECLAGRSWLSWLGGRPAGLRLAVLALAPVAAISLVWGLSARPALPFHVFRAADQPLAAHRLTAVGRWDNEPLVGRMRSIHVAAAFATLDLSLLGARAAQGLSIGTVALTTVAGLLLVTCAVLLCTPPLTAPTEGRLDRLVSALRAVTLGLTVLVWIHVLTSSASWPERNGLPGYNLTVVGLFIGQAVLLAALGAVLFWHRDRQSDAAPSLGFGALAASVAAISLALTFSAELAYRVSDVLNRGAPTAEALITSPPRACIWVILGFTLAVLVTLVVAGIDSLASRPGRIRAASAILARDFPDAPADATPRLRQVRKAIAHARFTERLVPLAVLYACLAGIGMTMVALGLLPTPPGELIQRYVGLPASFVDFGIGVGSYLIAAIIVGLVIGGIFAYRTPGFRRYVGVLWDLGTFWPRAAHPFAPPCYAERAVPELTCRITHLVDSGNTVVLTGHSHGSVLLAATVLQLPPRVAERVALLTHGSPLRRLYARLFPAYVNDEVIHEIADRVDWRWVNLWRDTDPIGGRVFPPQRPDGAPAAPDQQATVDRRLRDPNGVTAPAGDIFPPPIKGHSPCEADRAFDETVRDLAGRLR